MWSICLLTFVVVEALNRLVVAVWILLSRPEYLKPIAARLPLGTLNDLAMGILLGLPFLIGLHLARRFWWRLPFRIGGHLLLIFFCTAFVFIEIAQLFFWNEFEGRFDSIAVNYLLFPREVIGNIHESFNLMLFLPIAAALAIGLYLFLRKPLDAALMAPSIPGERRQMAGVAAGLGAFASVMVYLGPFEISDHREINEVITNGFQSFLQAAVNNDARYDGLYPTLPPAEALPLVRKLVAQDNTRPLAAGETQSLLRRVDNGATPKRLNVVLVIEESFGSSYVDGLDNISGESVSPNVTRLAKDGLFFTNVYATGNRTVRALEALLTSFPPIPGVSTARRPGSKDMNSLAFLLKSQGYQTAFLYGGRAAFDNMGTFWSTIGFDRVWDQGDVADQGFTTIWGVADEYLFTEALTRIDSLAAAKKPFLLSLLTVSNHRPYVYPAGRIAKDPAAKRRENSATYADWAFGDFIARAQKRPWFDDTVFVFIGDHGPRVYGSAAVPVPSYRVPLLFYAPKHIRPDRVGVLGSSMDMAPTLLGQLALSYDSPFFGVDLMRVPATGGRAAMEHNFAVAYVDGSNVAVLGPRTATKGYTMRLGPAELQPAPGGADPAVEKKAIALFQTAHHMFYDHKYHELAAAAARPAR
jgi:phosphoglycerol transferase MdoB-like AlkP superfamily enzyme